MADDKNQAKPAERLAEIEKVVKNLLIAMKAIEKEAGEGYMPEGTYLGVEFKEENGWF